MLDSYNKKLSPYEYFVQLQLEYLSIAIRSKILFTKVNKNYWEDIRVKKKIKIEEFAQLNHLITIFSDFQLREEIENMFYKNGIPNFTYRDEAHEAKQKPFDLVSYYQVGEKISFITDAGSQAFGKITNYQLGTKFIEVEFEQKRFPIQIENCKRILFDLY